jgi:hypothetical protein
MGREGRVKGTRELVIGRSPFIAVYRIKGKRIEILRILHGAQQWPKSDLNRGAANEIRNQLTRLSSGLAVNSR